MSGVPIPPGQHGQHPREPDRLIGYLLRHAQHAWQLALDDALRPLGISGAGFGVLRMIQQSPGSSGAALAAESIYSPQATQQLLVTLEGAGLVERRADPSDARRRLAYLTEKGSDVLTEAYRRASELEERMTAGLSEAEFRQFRSWLLQAARTVTPQP
jgi:DNA-binding MarR family transcriptional regulator